MYALGHGVKQDFEKALYWYQQAVKRGYVPALSEEAEMYARGKGTIKDPLKALQLQEHALSMGSVSALHYLGDMYRKGLGVKKDRKKALKFYHKGAIQGDELSQFKLEYYQLNLCERLFYLIR